jgi:hypothetical protein
MVEFVRNRRTTMKRPRIREIERSQTELAHLHDQRAQLDAEILQLEAAQEARVEAVLLETIRKLGIARLPIGEVLTILKQLAEIQNMPVPASESAGAASDSVEVTVKISRNAAPDKRRELSAAGLRWNGRIGRWTGKINQEALEKLRRAFGERVEERAPVALPEEAGPERVDAEDSDASALGADVSTIVAVLATVAEPKAVQPAPAQSAATASLRVPLHSLRGFPRVRPVG